MGAVVLFAAVSVDGFVGRDDDMPGPLSDWYGNGEVEMTRGDRDRPFHVTRQTAEFLPATASRTAVVVCGRRLFDVTDGWAGRSPAPVDHPRSSWRTRGSCRAPASRTWCTTCGAEGEAGGGTGRCTVQSGPAPDGARTSHCTAHRGAP